jgi:hypothetical protein
VIHEEPPPSAATSVNDFLTGLHLQHFEHWLLRWFYVLGGLAGCVCIATGFIFFVEKRKRQHAQQGVSGARWVDAFAVTTVTGMLVATAGMLLANRLLPTDIPGRAAWEEGVFWSAWALALVHALLRGSPVQQARISPAWREQAWTFAALALAAVLANWIGTGDTLWNTLASGYWPVAGLDLALIVAAGAAIFAARRLRRRELGSSEVAARAAPLETSGAENA